LGEPPSSSDALRRRVEGAGSYRELKRRELEPREYVAARTLLLTRTELRGWAIAKQRGGALAVQKL